MENKRSKLKVDLLVSRLSSLLIKQDIFGWLGLDNFCWLGLDDYNWLLLSSFI